MEITDLQSICESLPGTVQDIKWEDHLCFNVGGKMYLVTSPDKYPHTASFKVTEEDFEILSAAEGCQPAPYLARYKWIFVDDISRFGKKEWSRIIEQSYRLIFSKLPAKIRKEIGA